MLSKEEIELLNQLQDVQLPDPIGWWPLAFSWWMLIFSTTSILIGFAWYFWDRYKREAYRREALDRLATIGTQQSLTPNERVLEVNTLLKQVALTAYGRQRVANLTDQAWLVFLKETANHIAQPDKLIDTLNLAYQAPILAIKTQNTAHQKALQAVSTWQKYAQQWIKGHHQ